MVEMPYLVGIHSERIAGTGPAVRMALVVERTQSPAEDVKDKVAAMKSRAAVQVCQLLCSEV